MRKRVAIVFPRKGNAARLRRVQVSKTVSVGGVANPPTYIPFTLAPTPTITDGASWAPTITPT